jgi:hypothetical protein
MVAELAEVRMGLYPIIFGQKANSGGLISGTLGTVVRTVGEKLIFGVTLVLMVGIFADPLPANPFVFHQGFRPNRERLPKGTTLELKTQVQVALLDNWVAIALKNVHR